MLAWGAVDAVSPTDDAPQTELKLDYAGGWGKYYANDPAIKKLQANYQRLKRSGKPYLTSPTVKQLSTKSAFARNYATKSFGGSCPTYTGPALAWFITACTAPDGSHWAVQSWQRALPNYGLDANATQSVWELRLSHWTTDLPQLTIQMDWSWHKWDHLFGTYTYRGRPVYGFASTPTGQPLDAFGRNLYVDTLDSAYGAGLEAGEQLPDAQPDGRLLLQRQPARRPPGRQRREVPRHDPGPGRDARRDVGGHAARRRTTRRRTRR